jgi:hypothetical protein
VSKQSKILLLDIETSPLVSYTWGLYEQNVIKRIKTFTILSVAYKWLGKPTRVIAVDKQSELSLLKELHKLLDEADIVIAHNGDSFDIRKINARFIVCKLKPPSPYKTIDTKKVAKRVAYFDSNSLNNLGIDMDEGEKVKHRGFDMWEGCMAGVKKDWADMKLYNKRDVDLLERIYLRLRPWITNHPKVSSMESCSQCGSSKLQSRGIRNVGKNRFQRFQCQSCGGWSKSRVIEATSRFK